jgi:hypothetical protein
MEKRRRQKACLWADGNLEFRCGSIIRNSENSNNVGRLAATGARRRARTCSEKVYGESRRVIAPHLCGKSVRPIARYCPRQPATGTTFLAHKVLSKKASFPAFLGSRCDLPILFVSVITCYLYDMYATRSSFSMNKQTSRELLWRTKLLSTHPRCDWRVSAFRDLPNTESRFVLHNCLTTG